MSKAAWSSPLSLSAGRQAEVARDLRRLPGLGQPAHGPLPSRGRGRVRAALAAPRSPPERDPAADGRAGPAAAQAAGRGGPGRRRGHDRLAPGPHHPRPLSRATINRILTRAGAVVPGAGQAPQVLLHPLRGRPAQRDLAVRLHPLPAHPTATAAPAPTSRSSPGSTTTPATPCSVTAHRRVTGPIVLATFRTAVASARHPGLHADRQRHGLHHPLRRRQRRPQRPRDRTTPPARHAEELPPEPPHHLRQGRTLPTDPQELAPRPTRPAHHDRRAPGPPRRLRRRSTTTTAPTAPSPTAPPRPPPTPPGPKPPRPATAPPTPTTASATTASTTAGAVTLRVNGRLHHIGIGRTHARTPVILLVQDLHVTRHRRRHRRTTPRTHHRPRRDYQPTGRPPGPHPKKTEPNLQS